MSNFSLVWTLHVRNVLRWFYLHTGWWMVDAGGVIGWAPAPFLVPVDRDLQEEAQENGQLLGVEKGYYNYTHTSAKSIYIFTCSTGTPVQ